MLLRVGDEKLVPGNASGALIATIFNIVVKHKHRGNAKKRADDNALQQRNS